MKKYISAILLIAALIGIGFAACVKKEANTYFANGAAPTLSASATTLAPPVADSLNNLLTLTWTNPHYATDSATELYTIQIDSSGRNFSKAVSIQMSGALVDSFSAEQLNNIAIGFGFSFNVAYKMDIRVISSYANNNQQLTSNTVTITYTPYVVPPKVTPPGGALFLVGSATADGWTNPVPTMTQQFREIDSVTYSDTFYLAANGAYDFLPVNGSWTAKYNVASSSVQGLSSGGTFQYVTAGGDDIPGPSATGLYSITVNFQTGIFTVTPVQVFASLYVPGDYQGWTPASAPTLASDTANGSYQGYVDITTTGGFKFTNQPNWNGTSYGDTAAAGESGVLSTSGNNLNIAATGYYFLQANTTNLTWTSTATTWSLIGDFNSWNADVPMTYSASTGVWTGTITAAAAGGFKMRANDNWNLAYGTGGPAHSLTSNGGGNIPITAGTHTITLNLSIPGYYFYTIQ
jgi:starch-binding outer membrane protein SusE/F